MPARGARRAGRSGSCPSPGGPEPARAPVLEDTVKIAVAGDHAGFELKKVLVEHLRSLGHEVVDLGAHELDPLDDYPDFGARLASAIRQGEAPRGILVCGSGVGVCIAVNKFAGVRAGICHDVYSARQGVEHDDMNVLCLGSRIIGSSLAMLIARTFVDAEFTGEERHRRRLAKVLEIEKQNLLS
ncbi:MAG: ribose 5-phosphate isomerase B [Planctomycetes bacterium]|nr:ribose 5-phosphate isomerase B [Planctomycetota bacterium]